MAVLATTDLGTYKRVPKTTVSGTYTSSGVNNVSVASLVPKGTKAIEVMVSITDATVGAYCAIRETGGDNRAVVKIRVANQGEFVNQIVMLDSSGTFDLYNSEAMTAVSVAINAVLL